MTNANDQRIIALLGRRDEPTDAVEEWSAIAAKYAEHLRKRASTG
jgi:hypothetical protein